MNGKRFLVLTVVFAMAVCGVPAAMSQASPEQEKPREAQTIDPEIVVPDGTVISVALSAFLNTKSTQVGDLFYADVVYPIWLQQRLVIPKGSTVRGTVTEVVRPGRVKGKGRLAVRIDDILLPNGVRRSLNASFRGIHGPGSEKIDRRTETVAADSSKGEDTGTVVGTAGQGAIIGALSSGGKGAAIGSGAGAAVGLATVLFSRGKDLVLEPGTQFDLELKQPMKFVEGELDFTNSELNSVRTRTPRPSSTRTKNPGFRPGLGFPWP